MILFCSPPGLYYLCNLIWDADEISDGNTEFGKDVHR